MTLIEFECQRIRFALPLASVRRVIPSAQPTLLPGAPEIVLGVLNCGGEVVVIFNFFQRIGLSFSAIGVAQQLLVVDVAGFSIGLVVDVVHGVTTREADQMTHVPEKFTKADFVESVIRLDDGLCIICDPGKFFFDDERVSLDNALKNNPHG